MCRKWILTGISIVSINMVFGQYKNQLVNSGKVLNAAYQLMDSNKYNLAIDTLLTVSESDTAYNLVQTELAYSYMQAKRNTESLTAVNNALSSQSKYRQRLIFHS